MEDRFADQPEEVVGSCPELGNIRQALRIVVEKVDFTDYIAEAEDKTAADQGRDQGSEDLAQGPMIFWSGFWFVFAAALTASLLTPSIPA